MSYQQNQRSNPYATDSYELQNLNNTGRSTQPAYEQQNPYAQGSSGAKNSQGGYAVGAAAPSGGQNDSVAFFGEVEDIKRDLVQYDDNIERIEGLHKKSLAESDVESQQFTQKQIDGLAAETRNLAETLKQRIKTLESKSQRDGTKRAMAENVKRNFMQLIQKYQATEATFRQRYRTVAERQFRIVQPDATDAEVQQAIDDSEGQQIFSQALLSSNRRGQARAALSEVQERHQEIQRIERTMQELAELFHDMEVLVAEQDEQVTQIDNQATQAQHDIEAGVGHQQKAIVSARKWRKKKWWFFIIIVIIIIVLALSLGLHFGLHNN